MFFQFNWASICTPNYLVMYALSIFFIMYHNIYIINNFIPRREYHVMGRGYI